jgi:hypothetical protein
MKRPASTPPPNTSHPTPPTKKVLRGLRWYTRTELLVAFLGSITAAFNRVYGSTLPKEVLQCMCEQAIPTYTTPNIIADCSDYGFCEQVKDCTPKKFEQHLAARRAKGYIPKNSLMISGRCYYPLPSYILEHDNTELMEYVCTKEPRLASACCERGTSPIHGTVEFTALGCLEILIHHGANVNAVYFSVEDHRIITPLDLAIKLNKRDMFFALTRNGACIGPCNQNLVVELKRIHVR